MKGFIQLKKFPKYKINQKGQIFSSLSNKILKPSIHNTRYYKLHLYKNKKRYSEYLHRLIGETFIHNPHNKPCINHLDGNKLNNKLSNLEWCTYSENNTHAFKILNKTPNFVGKIGILNHNSKKVKQINPRTNKIIKIWDSMSDVERELKIFESNISKVCTGNRKTTGGFKWIF